MNVSRLLVHMRLIARLMPAILAAGLLPIVLPHGNSPSAHQVAPNSLLPQQWPYQLDLYDWLTTIKVADVQVKHGNLNWDGRFENSDELASLWIEIGSAATYLIPTSAVRVEAKWFVLDDNLGAGIEGAGSVKNARWGNDAAYWYQRRVPTVEGNGNPYYRQESVGRRALIATAVDMMMTDAAHDRKMNADPRFLGGSMNGWTYAYGVTRHLLPRDVQASFEAGFDRMTDKLLRWGPNRHTPNMQTRVVSSMAYLYLAAESTALKEKAVRTARLYMFGFEDGELERKHNLRRALFHPAGYVHEGGSPETTYNGVSLFHLLEARAVTRGDDAWAFMDEPLRRMLRFKTHQYFKDPSDPRLGRAFYQGPSGYAGRTGNSYVYDQRGRPWRNITAADMYEEGMPLIRTTIRGRPVIPSVSEMTADIRRGLKSFNRKGFGKMDLEAPADWIMNQKHHWPPDNPYQSESGWYDRLSERLRNQDDLATYLPYDRKRASFSTSFDSDFWAYRATNQSQSFGFFIESEADAGTYSGWYGGSLQCFWTEDTGILILARKDKSGDEPPKENSRVWGVIDQWGTHHVWGRDAENPSRAFSSAVGRHHDVSYDRPSSPSTVRVRGSLAPARQEAGSGLNESLIVTNRFDVQADGLRVTHSIDSDGLSRVSELWATLPVYLRDAKWQADLRDTTIEYWDGAMWSALTTSLVSTSTIRLGRDYGHGPRYGYVNFSDPQPVRLSGDVWRQSYQGDSRVRNVHIDLHGTPGSVHQLPEHLTVSYTITSRKPEHR